jgi:hypothetical protein
MSKIENLNKVLKKTLVLANCDHNALKNIYMLKNVVTILFLLKNTLAKSVDDLSTLSTDFAEAKCVDNCLTTYGLI